MPPRLERSELFQLPENLEQVLNRKEEGVLSGDRLTGNVSLVGAVVPAGAHEGAGARSSRLAKGSVAAVHILPGPGGGSGQSPSLGTFYSRPVPALERAVFPQSWAPAELPDCVWVKLKVSRGPWAPE